ncbi:hypothetical protein [Alkaliphilus serpentinus]|uniref:Uncharacterized protein n=1 Tax=Alkaliphilus serpentinus TaxID=1482731 RepID=A0A833MDB7_9FIRM|nr:hypothetical protein [Alkaliphilus serpentinus]KAB3527685.1 hypothetical protein F8153_11940 [Alkaliphilus serpentinus]
MKKNLTLRLIKGGKGPNIDYTFNKAIVTKSRLMGTIALKILWTKNHQRRVQWFILDSEDHGIFDYGEYHGDSSLKEAMLTQRFMGHLGGRFVSLKEKEALFLVQHYAILNKLFNKELPQKEDYDFILKKKVSLSSPELEVLNTKIFETLDTVEELLHYYVMRAVGNDPNGMQYLLSKEAQEYIIDYKPVNKASVLLKNEISLCLKGKEISSYIVRSIIDTDGSYTLVNSMIKVDRKEKKVIDSEITNIVPISPEAVAEEIKRIEYIRVFKVINEGCLTRWLESSSINLLNYDFHQGRMLVEFRKNNDHVKNSIFQISGDILAIYFINKFNQLIVCYYNSDDFDTIYNKTLNINDGDCIKELCKFQLRASVIYEYAEMKEMDFLKYMNEHHLDSFTKV